MSTTSPLVSDYTKLLGDNLRLFLHGWACASTSCQLPVTTRVHQERLQRSSM